MPAFVLPWLIGTAGVAAAGYIVKKLSEDSDAGYSGPSLDEIAGDNEDRRRDAVHSHHRERMDSLARAVLAEHGIEVSSAERKHFVELALDLEDDAPLDALIAEIAPRAPAIREIDQDIAAAESELAALEAIAAPLKQLAGHVDEPNGDPSHE